MQEIANEIGSAVWQTLTDLIVGVVAFIPKFFVALIILLIGWLLARVLRNVISRVGARAGLDSALERSGLTQMLRQINIRQTPSALFGTIIYYIILLNFALAALRSMELEEAVRPLEGLIAFLPGGLGGLITLVLGIMFAQFVGQMVSGTLKGIGVEFHDTLGSLVRLLIVGVVVIIVMDQIGLEVAIISTLLSSTIILIIGGVALAFGLGGQQVARNVLAGFYARELFTPGDILVLDGDEGVLEGIGTLNAEIRVGSEVVTVPNTRLTEGIIRKRV